MRIGTHHFISIAAAIRYFANQGIGPEDVARKFDEGEIAIGRPATKPGDTVSIIDTGTRYAIDVLEDKMTDAIEVPEDKMTNDAGRPEDGH